MNETTFAYTVRELEAEVPMEDYLRECVDVPKFLAFCKACPNYGANWSCPPYDFEPETFWRGGGGLRLYARMLVPDRPGQDAQAAIAAVLAEKERMLDELLRREAALPGSRALAAGSCAGCPSCARKEGLPCRRPDRMRWSLEALGGDVGKTAERWLGHPILWIRDGVVPDYLLQVGALLLPRA